MARKTYKFVKTASLNGVPMPGCKSIEFTDAGDTTETAAVDMTRADGVIFTMGHTTARIVTEDTELIFTFIAGYTGTLLWSNVAHSAAASDIPHQLLNCTVTNASKSSASGAGPEVLNVDLICYSADGSTIPLSDLS